MKKIKEVRKAVLFTNKSDEKFIHTWDSIEYHFPAGKSQLLEVSLAYHFAKHLANRELNCKGDEKRLYTQKDPKFIAYMKSCISEENAIEAEDDTKLRQEVLNSEAKSEVKKEETEVKVEEDNFEGLDNERGAAEPEKTLPAKKDETSKSKRKK